MQCRYCKEDIPDGAKICRTCKLFQNSFRNWLAYFGTLAAFATVLGSLILYSVSTGSKFYNERIKGDKLKVITFKSRGAQTYLNAGGREIHLSHVELEADGINKSKIIRLNEAVLPGRFVVKDMTARGEDAILVHGLTPDQESRFLSRDHERQD